MVIPLEVSVKVCRFFSFSDIYMDLTCIFRGNISYQAVGQLANVWDKNRSVRDSKDGQVSSEELIELELEL